MPAIPALLQLSRASTRLRTPALCLYCRLQSRPVPNLPAFRRYSTSKNVESEKTESASSGNLFDYLTNDYAGSAEDILGEYPTREESEADGPPQVDFGSGTAEAIQDALSTPVDLSEFQTVKRGRPPKMSDIAGGDERFLRRGGTLPIKVDIKMLETMQKRNAYLPTKRKVLRDNAAIAEVAEKILTFTDTGPEDIKNVVEEIETLKPEESVIPEAKFMELKKQIGKRLAKRHLQAYLAWSASNNKDVEIKSKKLKELATYGKKEQLSEAIMEHIWKIFIKERVERIVSEKIKVSKILVYFLLLDGTFSGSFLGVMNLTTIRWQDSSQLCKQCKGTSQSQRHLERSRNQSAHYRYRLDKALALLRHKPHCHQGAGHELGSQPGSLYRKIHPRSCPSFKHIH